LSPASLRSARDAAPAAAAPAPAAPIRVAPAPEPAPRSARHANLSGQVMGTKGLATRRRLITAMIGLLANGPLRDITVKAIAAAAGLSPGTFYLYFRSVPECLLAAAGTVSQSSPAMLDVLEQDWSDESGPDNALNLVLDHLAVWEEHRTLLRLRNLAAEEKDPRFLRQRQLALGPAVRALAALAARQQAKGMLDPAIAPEALSSALFAMLDLVISVIHVHDNKRPSVERSHIEAASYVVAAALGCVEDCVEDRGEDCA